MSDRFYKKIVSFALAVLLIAAFAVPADASAAGAERKTVRVGYYEMKNVMEGASEGAAKSGADYELLQAVLPYTGWKYEYVYGSFADLYAMFENGELDILPELTKTPERARRYFFASEPFLHESFYIVAANRELALFSYDDDITVGTTAGVYHNSLLEDWIKSRCPNAGVRYYESMSSKWDDLREGKVDFIAEIDLCCPTDLYMMTKFGDSDTYFAFGSKALASAFDAAMARLNGTNPYAANSIKEKYYFSAFAGTDLTREEKTWLSVNRSIRIGTLEDDYPMCYTDDAGQVTGIIPDLIAGMFEKLCISVNVSYTFYPSMQDIYKALEDGEIDLICPEYSSYYMAEEKGLLISDSFLNVGMGIAHRGVLTRTAMSKLAAVDTRLSASYVRDFYPEAETVYSSSVQGCIDDVLSGRAGAAVANVYALQQKLGDSSRLNVTVLNTPCKVSFASNAGHATLIRILNRGISLIADDEIRIAEIEYRVAEVEGVSVVDFFKEHLDLAMAVAAVFLMLIVTFLAFLRAHSARQNLAEANKEISAAREEAERQSRALEDANGLLQESMLREKQNSEELEQNLTIRTAEIREKNLAANRMNENIIELLGGVVEIRDQDSGDHIRRVKSFTRILAGSVMDDWPEYGLTSEDVSLITSVSALHDVGKILIPDSILLKPGTLTPEEYEIMKKHCELGCNILERASGEWNERYLSAGLEICRSHHERWDGKGYPDGLSGDEIPIAAQIVAVADCFDALTSNRVYKEAYSTREAVDMIISGACGLFSDKICSSLAANTDSFVRAAEGLHVALDAVNPRNDTLQGLRFLLVDDNELSLEINQDILEAEGANVTTVPGGREAIEVFEQNKNFDVILMDIFMPGMDGIETTAKLRAMESTYCDTVPIIALTAEADDSLISRCIAAGADAGLKKPLLISELTKTLFACMRLRSESMERRLARTIKLANTDALTKVRNITAYTEEISVLSEGIKNGTGPDFAVVMCDIDNLKSVNDSYGHDVGDIYIKNCCRIICSTFLRSPVYRIGGDEFVAVLRGEEFSTRISLMHKLERRLETARSIDLIENGRASLSFGIADFNPAIDRTVSDVVKRANASMYESKNSWKATEK